MKRAAIYHRVSTVEQDASLARDELRQAARVRGLDVVLDEEETGSGARNDRPGLLRVLEAARRGRVDWVLVWKLDRWGRSALDLLSNVRELQRAGVRFVAVSQGLEVRPEGDAISGLVLGVLAAVAEFERDLIVERTRLGLDKARRRGRRLGRPPTLADPDAHQVAELRAAGRSWSAIAKQLGCAATCARRAFARAAVADGRNGAMVEIGGLPSLPVENDAIGAPPLNDLASAGIPTSPPIARGGRPRARQGKTVSP